MSVKMSALTPFNSIFVVDVAIVDAEFVGGFEIEIATLPLVVVVVVAGFAMHELQVPVEYVQLIEETFELLRVQEEGLGDDFH